MEQLSVAAQKEAQGIETCVTIVCFASLHRKGMHQGGLHQQQRSEIEIVADAARLIIDDGVGGALAVDEVVVVCIDHRGVRVGCHAENAFQGTLTHFQPRRFRLQQHIVGFRILCNGHQGVAAREVVDGQLLTAFQRFVAVDGLWVGGEQEDVLHRLAGLELCYCPGDGTHIVAGQKTVYFFSHEGLFVNY